MKKLLYSLGLSVTFGLAMAPFAPGTAVAGHFHAETSPSATSSSSAPAPAPTKHPVGSDCNQGWYVNPDEKNYLPDQVPSGFLFKEKSIVHHAIATPKGFDNTVGPFTFTATVEYGVAPVYKMETTGPYSTINVVPSAGGELFWSSKVASGPGSQSTPLDNLSDFVGLTTTNGSYTEMTKIYSYGVGYANDQGNKSIVKSITFGDTVHDLRCPKPTQSASATASPSVSTVPVANDQLPITGAPIRWMVAGAAVLLTAGIALAVKFRRKRIHLQS